ncbi:metallophosphoesterase [Cereibacter sphaeroides WS8N]|uniref:metallophosphoesterase family protein n=1 Tax=Cereibacter sphaeroides TaxID=1063 RepID=UPI00020DF27F|nr:metallophosphoesterase family protein [Cereibacter sphaeroides]EGJ22998.1 metallophosphoesterase [Cereibacter sphaeroides WS8N]
MRLAVLADIHGNADALEAVRADLALQSPDLVVNLGDCLSGPLEVERTADLLMEANWPAVRGNHDRWLVEPEGGTVWETDARPRLSAAQRDWLAALPATRVEAGAFLCHATPGSDLIYWLHHVTPEGHVAPSPLERISRFADGIAERLILCGHTHLARSVRLPDGRLVVNPGSVGCPGYEDDAPVPHRVESGTPAACYAILDRAGHDWRVTFRQIPYDHDRAARLAGRYDRPDWETVLATGWLPPQKGQGAL